MLVSIGVASGASPRPSGRGPEGRRRPARQQDGVGDLPDSAAVHQDNAAEVRGRPVRDHLQHRQPRLGAPAGHQVHVRLPGRPGAPARDPGPGGGPHVEVQQPPAPLLGQPHQEPQLCLRRPQVQHRRLVPVRRGADVHGLLLHVRPPPRQGFSQFQAPLRQRYTRLQRMGRKILRRHQGTPISHMPLICL